MSGQTGTEDRTFVHITDPNRNLCRFCGGHEITSRLIMRAEELPSDLKQCGDLYQFACKKGGFRYVVTGSLPDSQMQSRLSLLAMKSEYDVSDTAILAGLSTALDVNAG